MFKKFSKSPNKPSAAPVPSLEDDYATKRKLTAAKLDNVWVWTSLYEGKRAQLEDKAKITLRKGEKPSKELEDRILYFNDTIAAAQEDFRKASRTFEVWTTGMDERFGKDIEARVEAHLEESRKKLRTLKYSDLLPDAEEE